MNLLNTLDQLSINNISNGIIKAIYVCLTGRLSWLEFREPESEGMVYSDWEDKCERIQEAIDQTEDILDELKSDNYDVDYMQECIDNLKDIIFDYQLWYKGLSRLKITL